MVKSYAVVYNGEPSNVPKPSTTLMNAYILPENTYYIKNMSNYFYY